MSERLVTLPPVHEEPDTWHRHTREEGVPQPEHAAHVNTAILLGVFVAIVVFVSGAILFTYIYFTRYMTALRQERVETTAWAQEAQAERERIRAGLHSWGWVDVEKGVVAMPLEVARERVLAAYGRASP